MLFGTGNGVVVVVNRKFVTPCGMGCCGTGINGVQYFDIDDDLMNVTLPQSSYSATMLPELPYPH
jgi:hypothetical protein